MRWAWPWCAQARGLDAATRPLLRAVGQPDPVSAVPLVWQHPLLALTTFTPDPCQNGAQQQPLPSRP